MLNNTHQADPVEGVASPPGVKPMDDAAAAAAARLSKRERELLLWLDGFRLLPACFARWNLRRKGLIHPWIFKGLWCQTFKGQDVANAARRELERHDK